MRKYTIALLCLFLLIGSALAQENITQESLGDTYCTPDMGGNLGVKVSCGG